MSANRRVGLLGFGEVGQVLVADLREQGVTELVAWDVLFPVANSGPSRAAVSCRVRRADCAGDAIAGANLVISAVTAGQCVAAAASSAPSLEAGAVYLDLNSVSPSTRIKAGACVEASGAMFVESAVMSPIAPKRMATAMLIGGPHAATLLPLLHEIGFTGAAAYSKTIGRASAAKMCRSVVVKGMEALLTEALLAARHHGVEQAVLDSLGDLFPGPEWRTLSRYMVSRSLQHGRRRAEEMREAALTVEEAGIGSWMSAATVERQDWAAAHSAVLEHAALEPMLDAILSRLATGAGAPRP